MPSSSFATRAMWVLALVLSVGLLSLAVAALPGRLKPLFLLPLVFGLASSGVGVMMLRSLGLAAFRGVWLVVTALALGGYGQVVHHSFQVYQAAAAKAQADPKAALALRMLRETQPDDVELARRVEESLARTSGGWDGFLERRYAALGKWPGPASQMAFAVELILVIIGAAIGKRVWSRRFAMASLEMGAASRDDLSGLNANP